MYIIEEKFAGKKKENQNNNKIEIDMKDEEKNDNEESKKRNVFVIVNERLLTRSNKKKIEVKDMEAKEENVNGKEVEDHYTYEKKKN